jgi:hypothetical protein
MDMSASNVSIQAKKHTQTRTLSRGCTLAMVAVEREGIVDYVLQVLNESVLRDCWPLSRVHMISWLAESRLSVWFRQPPHSHLRHVLLGVALGISLSLTSTSLALYFQAQKRDRINAKLDQESLPIELRNDEVLDGVIGLIGIQHTYTDIIKSNTFQETHP